jgi:hypothetical protein
MTSSSATLSDSRTGTNAYRQVKSLLDLAVGDLGTTQLKNIAEPVRVYALEVGKAAQHEPQPTALPGGASEPGKGESHNPLNQL